MATPSVRSIRAGEHEDFEPGRNPFDPSPSVDWAQFLRDAQDEYNRTGRLNPLWNDVLTVDNGRVTRRTGWLDRNANWAIPALLGTVFALPPGVGAAGAGGGAAASGSAASSMPFGVGPTTFGAGGGAGTAAAGLTPGLLAENASLGGAYGAGTAGAAGTGAAAASGAGNALSKWLDPRTLAGLGLSGLSAAQGFREPQGMDDLKNLFGTAMRRSEQVQPLFDQLVTMTRAQMPDYTRQG